MFLRSITKRFLWNTRPGSNSTLDICIQMEGGRTHPRISHSFCLLWTAWISKVKRRQFCFGGGRERNKKEGCVAIRRERIRGRLNKKGKKINGGFFRRFQRRRPIAVATHTPLVPLPPQYFLQHNHTSSLYGNPFEVSQQECFVRIRGITQLCVIVYMCMYFSSRRPP